jgi:hypothetical protein
MENKVFYLSKGWKIFCVIFAVFAVALSSLMIYYAFPFDSTFTSVLLLIIIAAFVFLVVYFLFLYKMYCVTITDNTITIQNPFGKRIIDINNYKSYRIITSGSAPSVVFMNLDNKKVKKNTLELMVKEKEEIVNFLHERLIDLDEEDIKDDYKKIAEDNSLGSNQEEKFKLLRKAVIINRVIYFAVIGIGIASFIFTKYSNFFTAILCAAPFVLLMVVPLSNGLIKFNTKNSTLYPSILGAFIVPIAVLSLKSIYSLFRITNWDKVILPTVLLSLFLAVVIFIIEKNEKITKGLVISVIFFALWYGIFASVNINSLGEQTIAETYSVQILDKRVSGGKSTSYYLTVTQWGSRKIENDVEIGRRLYGSVEVDDYVTIYIYSGIFGIKYYAVRRKG